MGIAVPTPTKLQMSNQPIKVAFFCSFWEKITPFSGVSLEGGYQQYTTDFTQTLLVTAAYFD